MIRSRTSKKERQNSWFFLAGEIISHRDVHALNLYVMTGSFHSYKLFATVFMNYLIFLIVYYVTMWVNTLVLFTINKSNVL